MGRCLKSWVDLQSVENVASCFVWDFLVNKNLWTQGENLSWLSLGEPRGFPFQNIIDSNYIANNPPGGNPKPVSGKGFNAKSDFPESGSGQCS